jgi:hypothetical protein
MFDSNLAKKFMTHLSDMTDDEIYDRASKSDDVGMGRIIEEYPLRGNLLYHLEEQGVNSWDYVDKKCRYHRRESNQGTKLACRVIDKHLGKSYSEIKKIIKDKRLEYFTESAALRILEDIKNNVDYDYCVNSDGVIELKEKQVTTKTEYDPYRFKPFIPFWTEKEDKESIILMGNYQSFLTSLEQVGYDLDIYNLHCSFRGFGIVGYVCIDPDSVYKGLVLADYNEFFDKVSRCPLSFSIPKTSRGKDNAMKDLKYLGSTKGKKDLIAETYQPKFVTFKGFW